VRHFYLYNLDVRIPMNIDCCFKSRVCN